MSNNIKQYFYKIDNNINVNNNNYISGGGKRKWNTLSHNGLMFPPEYKQHNVPVIYDNQKIFLSKDAEEIATLYAKYIETDYIKNRIFRTNFWNDWKKILGKDHIIKSLDGCDFRLIYEHILQMKEVNKTLADAIKKQRDELENKYKFAIVDGKQQPVGNFRVEPPGIFIGRGCNPKLGMVKKRIYPEDITINIGKESPIPIPLNGHSWKDVIHDKTVEWLASWKDDITGKMKYVWLGAHSDLKGKSDMLKFDIARKLKRKIKTIREENEINLKSNDIKTRQIATALYFIDNFALRVGNEKGEDQTDTVGVTSLRVEHVELQPDNKVTLDFLGKDSVRYNRTLIVSDLVYKNLKEFVKNKNPDNDLFDQINSNDLNKYLQSFMKNLTAKVFRTFNASSLFQKELSKITKKYDNYMDADKINILLDEFNKANAKVALLCNHQKNINKSSNKQIEAINESIKNLKSRIKKAKQTKNSNPEKIKLLMDKLNKLKRKKDLKIELKNISLGTSKINYIDPRITISFLKKHNIPIDKVFSKNLQEKFNWATNTDVDFKF